MSVSVPPMHLVIFGRPGSGKSSLAEKLGAEFGYNLIRTGEMLRAAIRRQDFLGRRVECHLAQGNLVPDQLIFELLEQNLKSPGISRLLFDGFPRTMGQVPLLEQFEKRLHFEIDCYLEIDISREDAVARMTGRRVCPSCGATYHLIARPPRVPEICDLDGAHLESRPDDTAQVVEVRQQIYDEYALPILQHYQEVAPSICRKVNGRLGVDAVYAETRRALGVAD